MSKRAEPTLLTDQVYSMIHESIMNGDLPAGARLRVRDLAEQVGTSVMPVREAIRRLEEAGLAERVPHRGAVVKGLTLAELVHVYDVRRLLEVEAARLGAQRISAEDCDRMQAEFTLMRAAVDEGRVVALLDHDEALLSILYEAAANPVLLQTIRNLWNHCRAYKIVGAQGSLDSGGDDPLWRFQERLVAAARDRSGESAAAVNEESLLDATDRIKALLATEQAASADAG
ncbi:GntR family transcriptional regulator [Rhodococcus koreensis]|uniref:DNA-binding transcriptional regulator, GntR family n=2 Tax=Rhodococcus TaxID=1827 RepID=A0A1H4XH05_9NOCA|nr:GntR family transcriptional regulator [Rhodococcus koreensis]QSE85181.1 GntR family transcriptional regulator [Rhodococcus koreensis]SED04171.1 DNA-binding transcriptional regulator, GntR family [Rhodococcus koreensis]